MSSTLVTECTKASPASCFRGAAAHQRRHNARRRPIVAHSHRQHIRVPKLLQRTHLLLEPVPRRTLPKHLRHDRLAARAELCSIDLALAGACRQQLLDHEAVVLRKRARQRCGW
jgi:hypothetical protein